MSHVISQPPSRAAKTRASVLLIPPTTAVPVKRICQREGATPLLLILPLKSSYGERTRCAATSGTAAVQKW
jgi:hypothetical protein